MREYLNFYIDGRWTPPVVPTPFDVVNPATSLVNGRIHVGSAADVDAAVKAARAAFPAWSATSRAAKVRDEGAPELVQAVTQ